MVFECRGTAGGERDGLSSRGPESHREDRPQNGYSSSVIPMLPGTVATDQTEVGVSRGEEEGLRVVVFHAAWCLLCSSSQAFA